MVIIVKKARYSRDESKVRQCTKKIVHDEDCKSTYNIKPWYVSKFLVSETQLPQFRDGWSLILFN